MEHLLAADILLGQINIHIMFHSSKSLIWTNTHMDKVVGANFQSLIRHILAQICMLQGFLKGFKVSSSKYALSQVKRGWR